MAEDVAGYPGAGVLIVDDDEGVLGYMARALSRAGYEVHTARNSGEAVLAAERSRYDLLIADLLLPIMDGESLGARLLSDGSVGSLLFMTGKPGMERGRERQGGLLEKPFSTAELLKAVSVAIEGASTQVARPRTRS
jgi:DNA-binding response OmpR family regulator